MHIFLIIYVYIRYIYISTHIPMIHGTIPRWVFQKRHSLHLGQVGGMALVMAPAQEMHVMIVACAEKNDGL